MLFDQHWRTSKGTKTALVDPTTGGIKDVKLAVAVQAVQVSYDQFRETVKECTGEEVTLDFLLDSSAGNLVNILLGAIGLDLTKPVTTDSEF
jgi:hypothetical protein